MLSAAPSAQAAQTASVRLAHATPGAGDARLEVGGRGGRVLARAGFGQVTPYARVRAGTVTLRLRVGGRAVARVRADLDRRGRVTVLAAGRGRGAPTLWALRDRRPRQGAATVRVVNAAPELGRVDVDLGGRQVATGLGFRRASGYRRLEPGRYRLAVSRPGGDGEPLVSRRGFVLSAGSASTALIVGSGGERLRVVEVSDGSAVPPGAPATGLGGLVARDPGGRMPLALVVVLGVLAAGAAGTAGWLAAGRRRARRSADGR